MKQTTLLLILSLLAFPTYAHDRDPRPEPVPITPAGNVDHNNGSDNLKQTSEIVILTGAIYCIATKCWKPKEEVHFKLKTREP